MQFLNIPFVAPHPVAIPCKKLTFSFFSVKTIDYKWNLFEMSLRQDA